MRHLFAGVLVLMLAGLASAQIPTSGNVFLGYSFENASASALDNIDRPNLHGWEASVEGKLVPWIGIVADVSGHYGSQSFTELTGGGGPTTVTVKGHEWETMFGPRVSVPVGKITPFGEFMVGFAHMSSGGTFSSDTSFASAVGGGFDYRLIRPIAWRVEGDYVHTSLFGTTQNDIRLSTGIVVHF